MHTEKRDLWKIVFVTILFAYSVLEIAAINNCRIANIINGYSLKLGLNQPNIKNLGNSNTLALCKKLSCREDIYDFGLFDGKSCYGIVCLHDNDKRCMLKRDGNAVFTIFKINAKKAVHNHKHHRKKLSAKSFKFKTRHAVVPHKHSSNVVYIPAINARSDSVPPTKAKKGGVRMETSDSLTKHRSKNLQHQHRKRRRRRPKRKVSRVNRPTENRVARDYPFLYNRLSQSSNLPFNEQSMTPYGGYTSNLNSVYAGYNGNPYNYVPVTQRDNIANPRSNMGYSSSYNVLPALPYNHVQPNLFAKATIPASGYPVSNTKELISPGLFTDENLFEGVINSLSPTNASSKRVLLNPAFFTNMPTEPQNESTEFTPLESTLSENAFPVMQFHSPSFSGKASLLREEVKPLSQFPTDTDFKIEGKDEIPRPDDLLRIEDQVIATKDSVIDVPFSSKNQLPKTLSLPEGLLNAPYATNTLHVHTPPTPVQKTYQTLLQQRCTNPIGISRRDIVSDARMSASSAMENFPPEKARLRLSDSGEAYSGSWCSSGNDTVEESPPFLQVDMEKRTMFCRVAIQGDDNVRKWVKRFHLQYSDDAINWEPYRETGLEKVFFGNEDEQDITYRTLRNPVISRFVRFIPVSWAGDTPCMRVELYNADIEKGGERPTSSARSSIPKGHSGLIEDLDFEKMDGSISLDRSSFGNNGFLYGGAKVYDTHSSCRHAVKIPLGADIVVDGSIMKIKPREAISIALWVQLNHVEGLHSIFDTVGGHSKHDLGQFHFEIVGGDVRWFHRNETEDEVFSLITDHKLIKRNEWNHIAATYDSRSGNTVIYVNGSEQVRGKGHGLISNDWSQRVGIGRHKGVRFLDGQIDDFKMYDFAITPEHVDELASKCDFSKYYCGTTLTDDTGSFYSPIYPETLEGSVECVWNIQGKIGETIALDMRQFGLGYKSDCGRANVEVRDSIGEPVIGVYCGATTTPRRVLSHSNHMYIKYYTDGAYKGEKFKINYNRVKKRTAKKMLVAHQCKPTATMSNVTLVGGAKAGNFTDLGSTTDMDDCKDRCCNVEDCEVAFLIDDNCYAVKCSSKELCQLRKAKSSVLNPQLSYMTNRLWPQLLAEIRPSPPAKSTSVMCPHGPVLTNVTLVGGIKSGNFTSHGSVRNFDDCLHYCCQADSCDLAFMVKQTCFSLKCSNEDLCKTRPAKPSSYNPTVSFLKRNKTPTLPATPEYKSGTTKTSIDEPKKPACKDLRLSKVHHDVTLTGGISAGEFTDKGHVSSMDECVEKCCSSDTCNVAFIIKDTCFTVKCKSYEECALKSAISDYYNPKIVYVNWNPPKDLGESVPYTYEGCWRDFDISAFALPLLEGTDPKLSEPYKKRLDPINDCSSVSQSRGYKVFAIQNGGACFSGADAEQTYKRYGKSEACKNGRGGPFANSVYKSFDDGSVIALGCWADLQDRAFKRMEKNDPLLTDSFDSRPDPIGICAKVATNSKTKFFAIQKGGQCFVAKERHVIYSKYSPSRKCKYGLGGQMANDVYMLKQNFTETFPVANKNNTIAVTVNPNNDIESDEIVYKEEVSGNEHIRYVYKADPYKSNVTLTSAINAGTFEDKGKMDTIGDCIKACGVSPDCNVAFMLSSQCFNVHCFSDETCHVKPAFSSFYKPELAFIKHRVIRKPENKTTAIEGGNMTCTPVSELSNATFVRGINSGNFSDMGHTNTMEDCKQRCCQDRNCHIAFKIQEDCYGVRCFSKDSCQTRPAKNTLLFNPQMALIRNLEDPMELAVQETYKTTPSSAIKNTEVTTSRQIATDPTSTQLPTKRCTLDVWDNEVVENETLIGGINSGEFRDHGQVDTMPSCMAFCCDESDCDLSFMIDKDCYTVKCYRPSLCMTRAAKPTSFVTQIAFKKASKLAVSKANLTELLRVNKPPTPENVSSAELAYASIKSDLLHPFSNYSLSNASQNFTGEDLAEFISRLINGINDVIGFVKETLTELAIDKDSIEKTFRLLYRGLSTTPTSPTLTAHKTQTVIPRPYFDSTPSTILNVQSTNGAYATPTFGVPKPHSCKAEPIIYNATLRLGMHSGLFTKLGRVKHMDDCIERCCRSSNADVAYMLGPFCFAVKCKTKEMCKPSPAMYSDITSLNLNPAISFLNKATVVPDYQQDTDSDIDILDTVFEQVSDTDDLIQNVVSNLSKDHSFGGHKSLPHKPTQRAFFSKPALSFEKIQPDEDSNAKSKILIEKGLVRGESASNEANICADSPINYNVTLRGGVHSGKFTELGDKITMRECVGKCCDTPLCDVAFMFSDKCYAVGCYDEASCQAVLAKPSSLNPKLAYVSKYRVSTITLDSMPSGIGFDVRTGVPVDTCSPTRVEHGPVFTNKTLLGGMKSGNFSFLGNADDINGCLSKCCALDNCDMAYLVNKEQCFSVECYAPALCQIADEPFKNRLVEISKLVKHKKKKKKHNRVAILAYLMIGLVVMASGLSGLLWAVMIFVRRSRLKNQKDDEEDEEESFPRPDR